MALRALTAKQEGALKANGSWPSWQQISNALQQIASNPYVQIIADALLSLLLNKPAPVQKHAALEAECPCPDGGCGPDCCCCCTKQLSMAITCLADGCCNKDCHGNCCCALHHTLRGLECILAHCCHDSNC